MSGPIGSECPPLAGMKQQGVMLGIQIQALTEMCDKAIGIRGANTITRTIQVESCSVSHSATLV
jgi:hypothetical protein